MEKGPGANKCSYPNIAIYMKSDKTDFKLKLMRKDKEGHLILIKCYYPKHI